MIEGTVRSADGASDCGAPIPNAELHLWQCDEYGQYDDHTDPSEWYCRAVVFTDMDGQYSFITKKPAPYSWRPAHVHFKVYAGGFHELTTQMYFNEDPGGCGPGQDNEGDCPAQDTIVDVGEGTAPGVAGTLVSPRPVSFDIHLTEDTEQQRWIGTGNLCQNEEHLCDPHAMCIHTGPGLHECECWDGYTGNGGWCEASADAGSACETVSASGLASVGACGMCEGDATGDRLVDVNDLLAVLSNYGRVSDQIAIIDVVQDGQIDVTDLLRVLARFGAQC